MELRVIYVHSFRAPETFIVRKDYNLFSVFGCDVMLSTRYKLLMLFIFPKIHFRFYLNWNEYDCDDGFHFYFNGITIFFYKGTAYRVTQKNLFSIPFNSFPRCWVATWCENALQIANAFFTGKKHFSVLCLILFGSVERIRNIYCAKGLQFIFSFR